MWTQMREKLMVPILPVGLRVFPIPGGASAYPSSDDTTVVSPNRCGRQNTISWFSVSKLRWRESVSGWHERRHLRRRWRLRKVRTALSLLSPTEVNHS
jgi:hypothetical protein